MRRIVTAIAAATAAGVVASTAAPAGAIVGGSPDEGEHPYVGQLLFYVPDAVDPRFDDPGAWFNCSGTLIDADTVVTAGHCTYAVGTDGEVPADPLQGGNDVWFTVAEEPDYGVLPQSSSYAPDRNAARYRDWSRILDRSRQWSQAESTYTHPQFVENQFLFHDLAVVELAEPIVLGEYGSLPSEGYLDQYAGNAKKGALFESVGYGLEESGPKTGAGGDTRRKATVKLVSFKGAYGLKDIAVNFSHNQGGTTDGGTCFGDSGGPTFDTTTPAIEETNTIVAVTSFGLNSNCTAGGSYRIDQPDDLAFLDDPAGAFAD